MAVHANRNLADNQLISVLGVVRDQNNQPHLLAETLNPDHRLQQDRVPPLLLIAVPDTVEKAGQMGFALSRDIQISQNLGSLAANSKAKVTEILGEFRDMAASAIPESKKYAAKQFSPDEAQKSYSHYKSQSAEFVDYVMGEKAAESGYTPRDALNAIGKQTDYGIRGHVLQMKGFIPTSHDKDQNVFDGYNVEFPDPTDPSKNYQRPVVVGTAMALSVMYTPEHARANLHSSIRKGKNADSPDLYRGTVATPAMASQKENTIPSDHKAVFTTTRVIMGETTLVADSVQGVGPLNEWSNTVPTPEDMMAKKTALTSGTVKGYVAISSDISIKNEAILAASNIPTVSDPDPERRKMGIRQFHAELGQAISDYNAMFINRHATVGEAVPGNLKDHVDINTRNTGLVIDAFTKTPTDSGKDGVRNGYKARQAFGIYIDLPDNADGADRDANKHGLSLIHQLQDIVNLQDQPTLDYLGERRDGHPPKFDYKTSKHAQLSNHFKNLVRSEIIAIRQGVDDYLKTLSSQEMQLPENVILSNAANDPERNNFKMGSTITHVLRENPAIVESVLEKSKLEPTTRREISRTTNALIDIEKKYAANTGLRAIFLAEREHDSGPIILNPQDEKLGRIEVPEWFHKGHSGMSDMYFEKHLLPSRNVTANVVSFDNQIDKVKVLNMPRASSIYGEMMRDMADIREGKIQTPELQKNRVLTNPTFQIKTVKRWTDQNSREFNQWYNGSKLNPSLVHDKKAVVEKEYDSNLYAEFLKQIQPTPRSTNSSLASREKQRLEQQGFKGISASFANEASLGSLISRAKNRPRHGAGAEFDSRQFTRDEKLHASHMGYTTVMPHPAYVQNLLDGRDGQSLGVKRMGNTPQLQNLEGMKVTSYAPAISVDFKSNASLSVDSISSIYTGMFTTKPQVSSVNPLIDMDKINAQLAFSTKSIEEMEKRQTPGLAQLQQLTAVASGPVFAHEHVQHAVLTMYKDKYDVGNTVERDYSNDNSYNNSNARGYSGAEHSGPSKHSHVVAGKLEEAKNPQNDFEPTQDQREQAAILAQQTMIAVPDFSFDDVAAPKAPAKPEVKAPELDDDDPDLGSP